MFLLLALSACSFLDAPPDEKPPEPIPDGALSRPREAPLPEGKAIVRECYAGTSAELPQVTTAPRGGGGHGSGGPGATGTGGARPNNTPPPYPEAAPPATAQAPADAAPPPPAPAAPPAEAAAAIDATEGAEATGGMAVGEATATSAPEVAQPIIADETQKSADREEEPGRARPAPEPKPAPVVADKSQGKGMPKDNKGPPRRKPTSKPKPPPAPKPVLNWGATTWLSNDDSMSLASAQRLLWAVQNKGPVRTSEIRPHELLNYFSFDTTPVTEGDTFSVSGSAETLGDGKLGIALAVKGVTPARRPLDLTMVLDRSGSMWAEGRMDYLKRGLTAMKAQLVRGDRVDLVLFDDEVCTPLEDYVVGRDDPALLDAALARLEPRGATDLDAGLHEGYRITSARPANTARNRRMLLISDALLNEGELDENVVSEIGKAYNEGGVRLSAIGVGRSFNDKVLDMLSEKGKGAYVYLGSEAVVDRIFGPGFNSLTETVANDVRFALDLPDSLAIEKFYGEESSMVKADIQPIDYYAGTTQLFLQDVVMREGVPAPSDRIVLTIEWTDPVSGAPMSKPYGMSVGELLSADPHNVRKGRTLMAWTDMILARSLGSDPCAAPYTAWADRVRGLGPDAEIAWLDSVTAPLCGREPVSTIPEPERGVAYKVKIDADQIIPEATLRCSGVETVRPVSGNVATFRAEPGACDLVLPGVVPLVAKVTVPKTGGDIRCVLRGGKLSCG